MGSGLAKRLSPHYEVYLYDRTREKADALVQKGYGKVSLFLPEHILQADLVILAVKPKNLKEIAAAWESHLRPETAIVSLLAGVPLLTLSSCFPICPVIRMMPNLALNVGEGAIGFSAEEGIQKKWGHDLAKLAAPLGKVFWIPETKMDAFGALAGSGPAFIFVLVEAMIDAGILMGLNVKDSRDYIVQMIKGSAALLEESNQQPGELKWQVTSPGGTTIAGLKALEEHGIRAGMINTLMDTYHA